MLGFLNWGLVSLKDHKRNNKTYSKIETIFIIYCENYIGYFELKWKCLGLDITLF